MTDEEQYEDNTFFNTKYWIRDVWKLNRLYELRDFLNEIIKDKEECGSE